MGWEDVFEDVRRAGEDLVTSGEKIFEDIDTSLRPGGTADIRAITATEPEKQVGGSAYDEMSRLQSGWRAEGQAVQSIDGIQYYMDSDGNIVPYVADEWDPAQTGGEDRDPLETSGGGSVGGDEDVREGVPIGWGGAFSWDPVTREGDPIGVTASRFARDLMARGVIPTGELVDGRPQWIGPGYQGGILNSPVPGYAPLPPPIQGQTEPWWEYDPLMRDQRDELRAAGRAFPIDWDAVVSDPRQMWKYPAPTEAVGDGQRLESAGIPFQGGTGQTMEIYAQPRGTPEWLEMQLPTQGYASSPTPNRAGMGSRVSVSEPYA